VPSDWTKDRAEIPPDGERQDITLDEVGFARGHRPDDEKPTRIVVRGVIDKGEYEGFRVSTGFSRPSINAELRRFLGAAGVIHPKFLSEVISPPDVVQIVKDHFEKKARFSARVYATEKTTDSERLVRYRLRQFDEPTGEADLNLHSEPKQFKRSE
jgi:hypothetical protein